MRRKRTSVFLALAIAMMAVLVSGQFSPARAQLAAVAPGVTTVLLPFPDWYADRSGVALAQCNFDGGGADIRCIPGAPLPGFEGFFWTGDPPIGTLDGGNASGVVMVMSIEAVATDPNPVAGVVFARIRGRVDLVGPGVYTLSHPYGVETFNIPTPGRRAINFTSDFPLPGAVEDFTTVLGGTIGPFLTCVNPAPPAGYIGDYGVPCTFTGSPFGRNFVRLSGPGTDNITRQLQISGKLAPAGTVTAPALTVTSATYLCPGVACLAEIRATADPTAVVTATLPGALPVTMVPDLLVVGGFVGTVPIAQSQIPLPVDGLDTFPVQTLVTATQAGFTLPFVEKRISLVDTVTITEATQNLATGILTIRAAPGDSRATVSEATFGPMPGGLLVLDLNGFGTTNVTQTSVTVSSTGAGVATLPVQSINVPEQLKITAAKFNIRRRRLTVTGTSTAFGATLNLLTGTTQLGTTVLPATSGKFTFKTARKRAPRFIKVVSSGGKSQRKAVTSTTR